MIRFTVQCRGTRGRFFATMDQTFPQWLLYCIFLLIVTAIIEFNWLRVTHRRHFLLSLSHINLPNHSACVFLYLVMVLCVAITPNGCVYLDNKHWISPSCRKRQVQVRSIHLDYRETNTDQLRWCDKFRGNIWSRWYHLIVFLHYFIQVFCCNSSCCGYQGFGFLLLTQSHDFTCSLFSYFGNRLHNPCRAKLYLQ